MPAPEFFGRVSCKSCPFWQGRQELPKDPPPEMDMRGPCHREPFVQMRKAEDWCGEHPAIQAKRHRELADMIAARMKDQEKGNGDRARHTR